MANVYYEIVEYMGIRKPGYIAVIYLKRDNFVQISFAPVSGWIPLQLLSINIIFSPRNVFNITGDKQIVPGD